MVQEMCIFETKIGKTCCRLLSEVILDFCLAIRYYLSRTAGGWMILLYEYLEEIEYCFVAFRLQSFCRIVGMNFHFRCGGEKMFFLKREVRKCWSITMSSHTTCTLLCAYSSLSIMIIGHQPLNLSHAELSGNDSLLNLVHSKCQKQTCSCRALARGLFYVGLWRLGRPTFGFDLGGILFLPPKLTRK